VSFKYFTRGHEGLTWPGLGIGNLFNIFFLRLTVYIQGLCKLADSHHRIKRALDHDGPQLQSWMELETERRARAIEAIEIRKSVLSMLRENDDEDNADTTALTTGSEMQLVAEPSLYRTCMAQLKDELEKSDERVRLAEEEEEYHRKVSQPAIS
jgi:hypothetical protein